ncbi:MAG TPA: arginase family protein [Povalibacter sp.]|nr:arginase family protein [Povalibacter sp.]
MNRHVIIEAPTYLGLRNRGVDKSPQALLAAGLAARLQARCGKRVVPGNHSSTRDFDTLLLNPHAVADYAVDLAATIDGALQRQEFPVVLGGDGSILLASALTMKRLGRAGLLFLGGHADFYQPAMNPTGEIASSVLALATGRGPRLLTHLDGESPLVQDEDVVVFGFRDEIESSSDRSQPLPSSVSAFDLPVIRRSGIEAATARALARLTEHANRSFWIHLDVDVLDDTLMPAVDYRLAGGLAWEEVEYVLRVALATGRALGLHVVSFNPGLDTADAALAQKLAETVASALAN